MSETEDFEYEIIDVYEFQGSLVVEVESEYGKQKIGLSLDAKYLGNDGQPKWKKEVHSKMTKRYGNRDSDKALIKKSVFAEEVGKKHKITKTITEE